MNKCKHIDKDTEEFYRKKMIEVVCDKCLAGLFCEGAMGSDEEVNITPPKLVKEMIQDVSKDRQAKIKELIEVWTPPLASTNDHRMIGEILGSLIKMIERL